MKLDELFPREKFPLRARTKVQLEYKGHALIVEAALYYQMPPNTLNHEEQELGQYQKFTIDGNVLVSAVIHSVAGKEKNVYIEKLGEFTLFFGSRIPKPEGYINEMLPRSADSEKLDEYVCEELSRLHGEEFAEELYKLVGNTESSVVWEQF